MHILEFQLEKPERLDSCFLSLLYGINRLPNWEPVFVWGLPPSDFTCMVPGSSHSRVGV